MDPETLISVERVSRWYGRHLAVDEVSFSVRRGEVLGFLGPNGAGKTTTMRMLCGVLAASSGRITIAGRDLVEDPKAAKRHIGYLPEQPPLYPDLTVDQYLDYCARLRGLPRARRQAAIANARERCGLSEVGGRLIGNLSRGYQQRAGIAQAIVHSPSVVILDEPTTGLDPKQIVEIRELITELGDDHSVILSTHILGEVQTTCDRVLIINRGRLLLDRTLEAIDGDSDRRQFTIALRSPPVPEELDAATGVVSVQAVDRHRFRITFIGGDDAAAGLLEHAARSGWGPYELVPDAGTLEEIFLRMTSGDAPEAAGDAR
ncbi:MAG TPA: ATP-binding cassette domain-containing protein [Gammaproteobacteria bacterium]|jgi:ABC-2 type transport system ATP-binding protein